MNDLAVMTITEIMAAIGYYKNRETTLVFD